MSKPPRKSRTKTKAKPVDLWPEAIRNALKWPAKITVSEWADQHRVLDPLLSSEGGQWHTDRAPYQREWMDSAHLPWVEQVTVMKSTQVGGTEFILNFLGYAVCQDPGPIIYVLPNKEEGEKFVDERFLPMVRLCRPLREQLMVRKHSASSKKRRVKFRRCRMRVASAGVATELAQFPARYLLGDECDKWPAWTGREAAPFQLAKKRMSTYPNAKILLSSTPVLETDMMNREFLAGDQRRFHVPCPHCGAYQVLRWDNLKWPKDVDGEQQMWERRDAWFECVKCKGKIVEAHKRLMLAKGVWIPNRLDVEDLPRSSAGVPVVPDDRWHHRSYHIWAAYSPWLQWWKLAAEWLKVKDTPQGLMDFVNSNLGEPWVQRVEDPSEDLIRQCVGGYGRGQVPEGVLYITAGVDVQKRFLVYTVRGWGLDMQSWLLDHGRVDDFEQLQLALLAKNYPRGLRLGAVFIDTRYRTPEVIDFAQKHRHIVKPLKGVASDDPKLFTPVKLGRHPQTGAPIGMVCWHVNVHMVKDELAGHVHAGNVDDARGYHVYEEVDETYVREMSSEHKILDAKTERETWVRKHGRHANHYWDTEVYNLALAKLLQVDVRFRSDNKPKPRPQAAARRRQTAGLDLPLFGGESA